MTTAHDYCVTFARLSFLLRLKWPIVHLVDSYSVICNLNILSTFSQDMSSLVKCICCGFRGSQTDFPQKANLGYLKTCGPCTEKQNDAAQQKWLNSDKENHHKPKQCVLGKDKSIGGSPTLTWDNLIVLLSKNKHSTFELHAIIHLNSKDVIIPDDSEDASHALATHIAKKIWKATEFCFKWVIRFLSGK